MFGILELLQYTKKHTNAHVWC